jgi:hypothetical protein
MMMPKCPKVPPPKCVSIAVSSLGETSGWRGLFGNPARPELLGVLGEGRLALCSRRWRTSS